LSILGSFGAIMREDEMEDLETRLNCFSEKVMEAFDESDVPTVMLAAELARILDAVLAALKRQTLGLKPRDQDFNAPG